LAYSVPERTYLKVRLKVGGRGLGLGWGCYHAPSLLGAGEVKLKFWALIWKEKGNIHIAYDCIPIVTISTVGSWNENKHCRRMRGMKLSGLGEGAK
jgi:hypothetical protein